MAGRKSKPYHTSWDNLPVAGLAKDTDGRWRVVKTGYRFTEPDERRAVARFYQMTRPQRVLRIAARVNAQVVSVNGKKIRRGPSLVAMDRFVQSLSTENPVTVLIDRIRGTASVSDEVDASLLADWLREQLTEHPGWMAKFVGIPQLGVARVAGLDAGFRVEWDTSAKHDQVLITGVAGKFDIGGFGATVANPTPDQKLDFVAKVIDGDGDSSTSGFSIGIDGTGIFDDGIVAGVTTTTLTTLFSSEPIDELAALLA